ncbi:MAG: Salicylate hydroxylase [Chthonomonadaceae bacterium]|nr:Salicylate hydroxylase [Chthonomonadaceae bacterium]
MADPEVLIVGAGPTGLAMAAEFARFGVSYRLIDRAAQPAQWSQALVVQARTLEQFERYGIADTAVERGCKIHEATALPTRPMSTPMARNAVCMRSWRRRSIPCFSSMCRRNREAN